MAIRQKKPRGPQHKYNAEIHSRLVNYVRAGVFPIVAARACGLSSATFHKWMHDDEDEDLVRLRDDIRQAHYQGRAAMEIEVRRSDPLRWATRGGGRIVDDEDVPLWNSELPVRMDGSIVSDEVPGSAETMNPDDMAALLALAQRDLERRREELQRGVAAPGKD